MKLYSILLLGFFVPSVQAMEEKEQASNVDNTIQAIAIACTAAAVANANTPPTAGAPQSQRLYWDEEIMMPIEPQYRNPNIVYKRYNPNGN